MIVSAWLRCNCVVWCGIIPLVWCGCRRHLCVVCGAPKIVVCYHPLLPQQEPHQGLPFLPCSRWRRLDKVVPGLGVPLTPSLPVVPGYPFDLSCQSLPSSQMDPLDQCHLGRPEQQEGGHERTNSLEPSLSVSLCGELETRKGTCVDGW